MQSPHLFFFFPCVYLVMFDFDNLRVSSEFSGINGLFSPPTQREADKYSFFQAIWCNYSRFTISIWSMPQPTKSTVKAFKIRLGSQNPISSSCHTSWLIKHSNNVTDVRLWDVLWISLVFLKMSWLVSRDGIFNMVMCAQLPFYLFLFLNNCILI